MLQISPQELKFKVELKKHLPVYVSLTNPTNERVVFKVRTTSPKQYVVKPSMNIVEPQQSVSVQITMQPLKEWPSFNNCRDKFQILSAPIPPGKTIQDISPDTFDDTNQQLLKAKLKVVLEQPAPPSPVPEGNEDGELHPAYATIGPAVQPVGKQNIPPQYLQAAEMDRGIEENGEGAMPQGRNFVKDIESYRAENQSLMRELQFYRTQQGGSTQSNTQTHSFSFLPVLFAALLAFGLGYFLHHFQLTTGKT